MGSYLWSWHRAHPTVSPSQTVDVVSTRSTTYSTAYSASMIPPSPLPRWLRLKPVATIWSNRASGSMSPATCSTVNSSKGLFAAKASITQSRQRHMSRAASVWYPLVSA